MYALRVRVYVDVHLDAPAVGSITQKQTDVDKIHHVWHR